jgi:hypothetical protein
MQLLMESESGHTRDPYVQMLLEEPEFHGDGTRVVYDALQWALMLGSIILLLLSTDNIGLQTTHFVFCLFLLLQAIMTLVSELSFTNGPPNCLG